MTNERQKRAVKILKPLIMEVKKELIESSNALLNQELPQIGAFCNQLNDLVYKFDGIKSSFVTSRQSQILDMIREIQEFVKQNTKYRAVGDKNGFNWQKQ